MGSLISSKEQKEESIQIESNSGLLDIKSKYIIEKILNNLNKNKSLSLIKYNKKIQNKLDFDINIFKEYSESFSTIKLEITTNNIGGIFINNEGNESYYHIYFNDSKKEVKRNFLNKNEKVSKIIIIIDYQIKSFEKLFYNCFCVKTIFFKI